MHLLMLSGGGLAVDKAFVLYSTGSGEKKHQTNLEMHVRHGKAEKLDINNSTVIRLDLIKKGSGIASYSPLPSAFPRK